MPDETYFGWTNYETWLVASHILDETPALAASFLDAACSTHYDGFVADVTALAHNTWDGIPWFSEACSYVNWRELAETLRYDNTETNNRHNTARL